MLTRPRPLAVSAGADDVESPAVIGDGQLGEVAGAEQTHLGAPGVGVRHHVAQTPPGRPDTGTARCRREVDVEIPIGAEGHRHRADGAAMLGAMRGQGGDQAGVLEHARMQVVREVRGRSRRAPPHAAEAATRRAPDRRRPACRSSRRLMALSAIERPAICWLRSSCRSRAMRARSTSWDAISRPARSLNFPIAGLRAPPGSRASRPRPVFRSVMSTLVPDHPVRRCRRPPAAADPRDRIQLTLPSLCTIRCSTSYSR